MKTYENLSSELAGISSFIIHNSLFTLNPSLRQAAPRLHTSDDILQLTLIQTYRQRLVHLEIVDGEIM
jgi:hypothetical protein